MSAYAYYLFSEHGMLPSVFNNLDIQEKAFLIACVDKKIEDDKKAMDRAKRRR